MKLCRIAIDLANNMSAVGTKMYTVDVNEDGNEVRREYIPNTTRLWPDRSVSSNSALIPSVILYQSEDPGWEKDYFGWEAIELLRDPDTIVKPCKDIKYRYFVERSRFGENAEDFKRMLKYLMDRVRFEPGEEPDVYEISISYPVICQDADMGGLEELIGDILFEEIGEGRSKKLWRPVMMINEAECALRFALNNKSIAEQLGKQLSQKHEQLLLVVDIGGSTMELCLYNFQAQNGKGKYKRLQILRADDPAGRGMGSLKVDRTLRNKLNTMGALDPAKLGAINAELLMLRYFTPLKEEINENLKNGKPAQLSRLYPICNSEWMSIKENRTVTKAAFTDWCKGYTAAICEQIKLLCRDAGKSYQDINMVILTGGGCELYPVEDSIRALLKKDTLMLRPLDVSGVLDQQIFDEKHPNYINGLCPRAEVASLACVLGNLAEDRVIDVPKPAAPKPAAPTPEALDQMRKRGKTEPKKPFIPPAPVMRQRFAIKKQCGSYGFWAKTFGCSENCKHCASDCVCDAECSWDKTCARYCIPDCRYYSHCDSDCYRGYDSYCSLDCGWAFG